MVYSHFNIRVISVCEAISYKANRRTWGRRGQRQGNRSVWDWWGHERSSFSSCSRHYVCTESLVFVFSVFSLFRVDARCVCCCFWDISEHSCGEKILEVLRNGMLVRAALVRARDSTGVADNFPIDIGGYPQLSGERTSRRRTSYVLRHSICASHRPVSPWYLRQGWWTVYIERQYRHQ